MQKANSAMLMIPDEFASDKDVWTQLEEKIVLMNKRANLNKCMVNKPTNSNDSVKSTSPPPPTLPVEVVGLDSERSASPSLLDMPEKPFSPTFLDVSAPVKPMKRVLEYVSQDYAITAKRPAYRMWRVRPNIRYLQGLYGMEYQKQIFDELLTYTYESIIFNVHGRVFTPKRKVLTFADPGVSYSFSGVSMQPKPWTFLMQCIRAKVEDEMGYTFNHALLNYYKDGKAKLSQHKDNEDCVDTSVPVAIVSFGAKRNIQFTKKGHWTTTLPLHPGSLLALYDQKWNHGILEDFSIQDPRISISFRKIIVSDTVQPPTPTTAAETYTLTPVVQP